MKRTIVIILFLDLIFICNLSFANDNYIKKFFNDASIYYATSFNINTSINQWGKILDKPLLMGVLWKIYGLSPQYQVFYGERNGIYVIAPKGIEGDIYKIQSMKNSKVFEANGEIKHKKIPISISGKALFLFSYISSIDHLTVSLKIYIKTENALISSGTKLIKPILLKAINNKVNMTLEGIEKIIGDIENNKDNIRTMLKGQSLMEFNEILKK